MTFRVLLFIVIFSNFGSALKGQVVSDNFLDGDFTSNPAWTGNVSEFIVNNAQQLQLKYQPAELKPAYLSTYLNSLDLAGKEWRFDLRLDFAPSNSNKVIIWLASSTSDLLDFENQGSTQQGYYLEIGENGSNDAISLFYRNGSTTQLIARGQEGQFATAFDAEIRVRRDEEANWEIAVKQEGSGEYINTAVGTDNSYNSADYFGFICYFTSTRRDKFYFDNVYFGNYLEDNTVPEVIEHEIIAENAIQLIFSEAVDETTASNFGNYRLSPAGHNIAEFSVNADTVVLTFVEPFTNGTNYSLSIQNITDLSGNVMEPVTIEFFYFVLEEAEKGDVVINEFLPDPTPVYGMPEAEFVELYNRSAKFISLENWRITDNTSTEGNLPAHILAPGEYVILAPSSAQSEYAVFGNVILPSSWPALNNAGDSISIKSASGIIIDALLYKLSWYQDTEKQDGGYSLELINPELNCFDSKNWKASESDAGGTPGAINGVHDLSFTGDAPQILSYHTSGNGSIIIEFNKEMDLSSLENAAYNISPQTGISDIVTNPDNKKRVELILGEALTNGAIYTVSIGSVADCNGNTATDLSFSFIYDAIAPVVTDLFFLTDSIIMLRFDEKLETTSAMDLSNYSITQGIGLTQLILLAENEVVIIFDQPLSTQTNYTLTVSGIEDLFTNAMEAQELPFIFERAANPGFNQLLITEIMAKPLADQKLPNAQYVELYNPTNWLISLTGLQYMDARDTVEIGLNYINPGEYLIMAPTSQVSKLNSYGRVIGIAPWPNLNNAGDDLQLINADGELVHRVFYRDSWYKESYKKEEGGWSLEMIDPGNPCEGFSNWTASRADLQGSPGAENSVKESNPDLMGPELTKAFAPSANEVVLTFNETIYHNQLRPENFSIEPALAISTVTAVNGNVVKLVLAESIKVKTPYIVKASIVTDCVGNNVQSAQNTATFALVEEPEQNDVVLNEVLYDPRSGGVDFIELYNRSDKYINLSNWKVAGSSQLKIIFPDEDKVLAPGDILALTTDVEVLINQYPNSTTAENIAYTPLPNFTNGEGVVKISSANGALEESFEYSDELHLSFLRSVDGVSLERISPEAAINSSASWISASSTAGFATPGSKNSQLSTGNNGNGTLEASPKTFSHNAPGRNFTIINYDIESTGAIATVKIFDARGILIKTLANNESLDSNGFFRWDGDDNQGHKVRTGYYLIYFQLFSSNGNTHVIKEKVAVGANF